MKNLRYITIFLFCFSLSTHYFSAFSQETYVLDSLKQVLSNSSVDSNKVKTYIEIGDLFAFTSPDTAIDYYNKAFQLARSINHKKLTALGSQKLGTLYFDKGNNVKAIEFYHLSLTINEEIGDKTAIAYSLSSLGNVYSYQNDDDKTLDYYFKALAINEIYGTKESIASVLGNIGIVYSMQEDYDKTLEYYNRSIEISKEINDEYGLAIFIGNKANTYADIEKYDEALAAYKLSTKYYQSSGDMDGIATNLINTGSVYNDLEQFGDAIAITGKGLSIAEELRALYTVQVGYDVLSTAYKGFGNYRKSLEYRELWADVSDSLFNAESEQIMVGMSMQYETDKKEKQILQQQAELKSSLLQIEKEKADSEKQQLQRNMFVIAFLLMMALAGFVFYSYRQKNKANIVLAEQKQVIAEANEELNQQNEEVSTQRDELEEQRDLVVKQRDQIRAIHLEVSESINYATRLQSAILPEKKLLEKHVSDHFVIYKPKHKVSGDFYWWTHIENHTVITAADCTGHGVPGAFMSMLGISFLREIVQKEYITHTGVILRKLRKEIVKTLKQKGDVGEQKDGMDMAIISIDHENNMLQFSGANNPLYIIRDAALEGFESLEGFDNFYEIRPDKMPISIYDRMDTFVTHEIQLKKGDQLYMFSDGFADQFGGKRGKKFKYKPFKLLLSSNRDKSMAEQKQLLINAFDEWKGDYEQIDDVVVLGVKI